MAYKIVVVEDEPQVAELLRLILRHAEIEVFTALDGAAGLALIQQVKPQLVVLDIMMPSMNGWELYDAVRSDEALKQTPIIIESVLPERPERKHAFASSEIDHYFTKPFDTTRLRREVGRMLGNAQLWPPPKPRPPRTLPISATGEFIVTPEPEKAPTPAAEGQQPDERAVQPEPPAQTQAAAKSQDKAHAAPPGTGETA
jgi:DNA-binding response OmpR family regulator